MYLHIKNQKHLGDHIFAYGLNKRLENILFYSHTFYYKFLYFVSNRKSEFGIYLQVLYIYIYYIQLMNLKKMSRETQYIWKNMPLYMFIIMVLCVTESYCGNKYSSIFTHLIKHLINVFFSIPS